MRDPSFQTVRLARGKHSSPRHGACVMEIASMLAGERFSDRPKTVSPVIAAFLRGYNDLVDDQRRQDLIHYASDAVGTAGSESLEEARATRLMDWADAQWGHHPRPGIWGSLGTRWARRALPTDPDGAGIYAIRSIHRESRQVHGEVLRLLDELIAMEPEAAPEREREQAPARF